MKCTKIFKASIWKFWEIQFWTTAYAFTQALCIIYKQWLLQSTLAMKYYKKKIVSIMHFCSKLVVVILFLTFLSLSLEYLLKTNDLFAFKETVGHYMMQLWNPWNEYISTVIVSKIENPLFPPKILNQISYQRFNSAVFLMQHTAMLNLYISVSELTNIDHSTMHLIWK